MTFPEHSIQCACVEWFRMQYPRRVLFAIPNGAKLSGSALQRRIKGRRLKEEGLVAGVADLFLACPTEKYGGMFIEIKTPKGRQSPEQKEFAERIQKAGYLYAVARSTDDFRKIVTGYLHIGK